mmetsp:Transcript_733/g.1068  ORF Transcript_733/g.1068 Transcript_733/m.1068 type:complete len:259 (-) Transcript_733:104-880(-)
MLSPALHFHCRDLAVVLSGLCLQLPQNFTQGKEGFQPDVGRVFHVVHVQHAHILLALESGTHLLGDVLGHVDLGLVCGGAQMRRADHIGVGNQGQALFAGRGLLLVHIHSCPGHLARLKCTEQVSLVDYSTAGTINNAHSVLHLGNGFPADEVAGVWCERSVQGDEVSSGPNLAQAHQLDAQVFSDTVGHGRVEPNHIHPHFLGPLGHGLADAPTAHHRQGLPLQLDTHVLLALKLALLHRHVCGRHIPGHGGNEGEG